MISLGGSEAQLTTFVGRGDFTIPEVLDTYSHFVLRAPTRLVLWDLSEAKLTGDRDDLSLWRLAVTAARLTKGRRTRGKSAIVCSCPEDLGQASALRTYLRIADYEVLVKEFVHVETARAWLKEEPTEYGS